MNVPRQFETLFSIMSKPISSDQSLSKGETAESKPVLVPSTPTVEEKEEKVTTKSKVPRTKRAKRPTFAQAVSGAKFKTVKHKRRKSASKGVRKTKELSRNTGLPKALMDTSAIGYQELISKFESNRKEMGIKRILQYAEAGKLSYKAPTNPKKVHRILDMTAYLYVHVIPEILPESERTDENLDMIDDAMNEVYFLTGVSHQAFGWYKLFCSYYGLYKIKERKNNKFAHLKRRKGWEGATEEQYQQFKDITSKLSKIQSEYDRKVVEFKKSTAPLKDEIAQLQSDISALSNTVNSKHDVPDYSGSSFRLGAEVTKSEEATVEEESLSETEAEDIDTTGGSDLDL